MTIFICHYKDCKESFSKPNKLECHLRVHTNERPFICLYDNCNKAYTSTSHLKRHEQVSHNSNQRPALEIKCTEEGCNVILHSNQALKTHLKNYHASRNFKCSYCAKSFRKHQQLKIHEYEHTKVMPFKCTEEGCNVILHSNQALKTHLKNYHASRNFKCSYCAKSFRKHQQLKIHEYEHTKVMPFKCDVCEKSFLLPSRLKTHQKIHNGYPCDEVGCKAKFEIWTDFRKHKKLMHPIEHRCDICDKSFLNRSSLRLHVNIHKSEREAFHCPYDNCVRFYFFLKNLKHHIKAVHEGNVYKCEHDGCNKSYRRKKSLEQHALLHQPNYVPPPKVKKRRSIKKVPIAERLTGIKISHSMEDVTENLTAFVCINNDESVSPNSKDSVGINFEILEESDHVVGDSCNKSTMTMQSVRTSPIKSYVEEKSVTTSFS